MQTSHYIWIAKVTWLDQTDLPPIQRLPGQLARRLERKSDNQRTSHHLDTLGVGHLGNHAFNGGWFRSPVFSHRLLHPPTLKLFSVLRICLVKDEHVHIASQLSATSVGEGHGSNPKQPSTLLSDLPQHRLPNPRQLGVQAEVEVCHVRRSSHPGQT